MASTSNTPAATQKATPVRSAGGLSVNFRLCVSAQNMVVTWRDLFKVLAGGAAIATVIWHLVP